MAASSTSLLSPKDREPLKCVNDPNFAVICAFLEQFAATCAIEHPNFADLQAMLEDDEAVHADLIDLHVKLLRKIKYAVHVERWERSLAKFCYTYATNDAWELERFAYKLLKLPTRLRILKNLLESQFDNNVKFKTVINTLKTEDLRPVPLGRDKMGNLYWRTVDADWNIRIYQENQDEESLRIVASNRDELAKLIAVLSGKEPMIPNLAGLVDEDSSSNSELVTPPATTMAVVQQEEEEDESNEERPPTTIAKNEGHTNKFNRPSLLSTATSESQSSAQGSRITLLGKNNLAKINKFKLMNAKKSKFASEEDEEDEEEEEEDEDEEDEEEDNYDEDDMDIEPPAQPQVGSVIQERVVYIRGEGAGKPNNSANLRQQTQNDNEEVCGEAIEESIMFFCGEGAGRECDVGNPGENNNQGEAEKETVPLATTTTAVPKPLPKPMFFFGRPGCLKLSPMKVTETVNSAESEPKEKKLSLVAYDDSNSGSGNSQDSEKAGSSDNVNVKESGIDKTEDEKLEVDQTVTGNEDQVEETENCNSSSDKVESGESKVDDEIESKDDVQSDRQDHASPGECVGEVVQVEVSEMEGDKVQEDTDEIDKAAQEVSAGEMKVEEEVISEKIDSLRVEVPAKVEEEESTAMDTEQPGESETETMPVVEENLFEAEGAPIGEEKKQEIDEPPREEQVKEKQELINAVEEEKEEEQIMENVVSVDPPQPMEEEQVDQEQDDTSQSAQGIYEAEKEKHDEDIPVEEISQGTTNQQEEKSTIIEAPQSQEVSTELSASESTEPVSMVSAEEIAIEEERPVPSEIEDQEPPEPEPKDSLLQEVTQETQQSELVQEEEKESAPLEIDSPEVIEEDSKSPEVAEMICDQSTEEIPKQSLDLSESVGRKGEEEESRISIDEDNNMAVAPKPVEGPLPNSSTADFSNPEQEEQVKVDILADTEPLSEEEDDFSPVAIAEEPISSQEVEDIPESDEVPQSTELEVIPSEGEGLELSSQVESVEEVALATAATEKATEVEEEEQALEMCVDATKEKDEQKDHLPEQSTATEEEPQQTHDLPLQSNPEVVQVSQTEDCSETPEQILPESESENAVEEVVPQQKLEEAAEESPEVEIVEPQQIPKEPQPKPIKQEEESAPEPPINISSPVPQDEPEESPEVELIEPQPIPIEEDEESAPETPKSILNPVPQDDEVKPAEPESVEPSTNIAPAVPQNEIEIPKTPPALPEAQPVAEVQEEAKPVKVVEDEEKFQETLKPVLEPEMSDNESMDDDHFGECDEPREAESDGQEEDERIVENVRKVAEESEAPKPVAIESVPIEDVPSSDGDKMEVDESPSEAAFVQLIKEDAPEDKIVEPSASSDEIQISQIPSPPQPEYSKEEQIPVEIPEFKAVEREPEALPSPPTQEILPIEIPTETAATVVPPSPPQAESSRMEEIPVNIPKQPIESAPLEQEPEALPLPQTQKPEALSLPPIQGPTKTEPVTAPTPEPTAVIQPSLVTVEQPVPPPRGRRGRRSDPVVAENANNEILTETPRATRGQANKKESPKAAPLPPKRNSRKRKSSESVEALAVAVTEDVDHKVEAEIVPVDKEIKPDPEVKVEVAPPPPLESLKEEETPMEEEKHESDGEEENVTSAVPATSARKAPARGGRKGKRGRKPAAKPKVAKEPVETPEIKGEPATLPVKDEPVSEALPPVEDPTPVISEAPPPVIPEDPTPVAAETPKPAAKKGRRQNRMMGLYVDEIQPQEDVGSVRQSRRIAQIKIKEETDRRILEEVALDKLKDAASMKKKKEASSDEDSGSEEGKTAKGKSKGKGKVKKPEKEKKVNTTWHSNSNTSDDEDKEDEDEYNFGVVEEDPGSPLFKSDHEFSCESDVDADEVVPTKMARTALKKKEKAAAEDSEESAEEDNPDHACQKCGKHDHPEWILLCDTCDKGYHCSCLLPVLFIIPEGDWYCPQCQHAKLLERLTIQLDELDNGLKAKEREEARLRRLALNTICAENILPPDDVPSMQHQQENQQTLSTARQRGMSPQSGIRGGGGGDFNSESSSGSDSEDSDDMPIYKLRKRKQKVISYRFNDYDDLIDNAIQGDMRDDRDLSEIVQEEPAAAKAGNLGRGKDISTIMEAENEKTRKELSQSDASSGSEAGEENGGAARKKAATGRANLDSEDDDSEPIRKSGGGKQKGGGGKAGRKLGRKKNRKLNNLDMSSDDDGSDEDFEGSSADSEDSVEENMSSGSSDSMELALYRKKKGKNSSTTRRSVRARVKRFDRDFINDDDDDEGDGSNEPKPPPKRRKKKEESDFSDFDDDDEDGSSEDLEENERDLDSDDLCDDSDSESSEDRPWGSKKKKKSSNVTKVFSKNPILSAGKVPRNPKRKSPAGSDDNEKPVKAAAGVKKKKKVIASDDDDDDDDEEGEGAAVEGKSIATRPASSRRTRGKKINFLETVESGSSDDGIKPGVKRPDTPPEEREQFIKRQEEIKKMLAAKNTQGAIQAATPKLEPLKLKLSGMGGTTTAAAAAAVAGAKEQDPNSLSTIPRNIIQSAKALDSDYHKSRESGDEFDDELPDDFMDMEEDLDLIMKEDFGGEVSATPTATVVVRSKKAKEPKGQKEPGASSPEKSNKMGSLLEPIPPISAQPPKELLAKAGGGYPLGHPILSHGPQAIPHSVIQGMPPKATHLPPPPHLISDGQQQQQQHLLHQQQLMQQQQHLQGMQRMSLLPPSNMMPQGGQGGPPIRFMHGGPMPAGPSAMPQNVIVGPQHMQGGPSFPPYRAPLPSAAPNVPLSNLVSGEPPKTPKKRGRKPKEAPPQEPILPPVTGDSVIPTTVMGHEGNSAVVASPAKKGGRRKKVTPSREELQAAQAAAAAAAAISASGQGKLEAVVEPPTRGSILSERLETGGGGGDPKPGAPPPNLGPQSPYNPSVITRLPQPGGPSGAGQPPNTMAGPYPGQGGPPRFYQHQGIGAPPPNSIGMHHMQQHGNERMHFLQQHPRHMGLQPHMYRPPSSIYGNPYQGQHAPPPHLQRPQLDPHGVRPMHPQDYSNSYLPPQFGPYIPGHHSNPHIRGGAPPTTVSSAEDVKGVKMPPGKSNAGPPPPHPSQLAHYEALKASGGPGGGPPMYNAPYPGHPVPVRHPGEHPGHGGHPEQQPNRGEFSGLVSYFSSQHDDLEQQ